MSTTPMKHKEFVKMFKASPQAQSIWSTFKRNYGSPEWDDGDDPVRATNKEITRMLAEVFVAAVLTKNENITVYSPETEFSVEDLDVVRNHLNCSKYAKNTWDWESLKNAVGELRKSEYFISSDWQQNGVGRTYRTYRLHYDVVFGLEHTPMPSPIKPSPAAVAAMKKFNEKELKKTPVTIQVETTVEEVAKLVSLLKENGYL